ncbi:MAG: hypothetical protein AAF488_16295, partial [Planctomycetota bacterium]
FSGQVFPASDAELIGAVGSAYVTTIARPGVGGSGGGANANVSEAYRSQLITERRASGFAPTRAPRLEYAFRGRASYAPGTGGGGGGGVLLFSAGTLNLRSSSRLLARGGDAYQSMDLGGNGGGGAGGAIVLTIQRGLNLEPGYVIDVSGGRANRLPPVVDGFVPYESNVRSSFTNAEPVELIDGASAFGGLGGDGGAGRLIVQLPQGMAPARFVDGQITHLSAARWLSYTLGGNARCQGDNIACCMQSGTPAALCNEWTSVVSDGLQSLSSGPFLQDVVASIAVSKPIRLGLGSTLSGGSHLVELGPARRILSPVQPAGTTAEVLWQTAPMSLDVHGGIGEWQGPVSDPRRLDGREFVRFIGLFRSNRETRSSSAIRELSLPFRLSSPDDN